jgi:hypothetical protein
MSYLGGWQEWRDSNPQPPVLEFGCGCPFVFCCVSADTESFTEFSLARPKPSRLLLGNAAELGSKTVATGAAQFAPPGHRTKYRLPIAAHCPCAQAPSADSQAGHAKGFVEGAAASRRKLFGDFLVV